MVQEVGKSKIFIFFFLIFFFRNVPRAWFMTYNIIKIQSLSLNGVIYLGDNFTTSFYTFDAKTQTASSPLHLRFPFTNYSTFKNQNWKPENIEVRVVLCFLTAAGILVDDLVLSRCMAIQPDLHLVIDQKQMVISLIIQQSLKQRLWNFITTNDSYLEHFGPGPCPTD